MSRLAGLAAVALFAGFLFAQQPTIRTTVPLVTVPVSVTDSHARSIYGLEASDFVLRDDGKPRPVRVDVVDYGLAPVALVTAVQTSGMSLSALAKIRKVGSMITGAVVGANAEGAVLTFGDEVKLAQDFTADPDLVEKAFRALKPEDTTKGRMLDAVNQALKMLAQRPGPRRAGILIIGESKDRGSKAKLSDLIPEIQRAGVTIYSLTYSAYLTPFTTRPEDYQPTGGVLPVIEFARLFKQNTAEALTAETGGTRLKFETKSKLENDLIRLGTDIHSRYLLSFTPDLSEAAGFHRLQVRVKSRPDAVIRARPGYWTMPSKPES